MAGGSSLLLLWHPFEILIIFGGALGALPDQQPHKGGGAASFTGALGLVKGPRYGRAEYIQLLKARCTKSSGNGAQGRACCPSEQRTSSEPAKSEIFK